MTGMHIAPLDGNAAAGAFADVFGMDITSAMVTCAGCGNVTAFGLEHAYVDGPGVTIRCPNCTDILARVVRTPTDMWLDLGGSASWRIPAPTVFEPTARH